MRTRRAAAEVLAGPAAGALGAPVAPPASLDATPASGRGGAVAAGVCAGIAFVLLEIVTTSVLTGAAPKTALRQLAAAAIAGDASAGVLVVTLAGAFTIVLALAFGALVALVARRYARSAAWWTGAASGLTVYVVNFYYLLAPALRWIGEVRDQVSVLSPWYLVSLWP